MLINSSLSSYPAAKVLQSMYAALLDTLSAKSIIGYLFGANLITRDVKQLISSATTTKDGNEILLDHLYDTATKESLVQFAAVISGDKASEKVQPLGKELQQKLCQLKESSRCVTPCCAFIYIALYLYLGVFQCCHWNRTARRL